MTFTFSCLLLFRLFISFVSTNPINVTSPNLFCKKSFPYCSFKQNNLNFQITKMDIVMLFSIVYYPQADRQIIADSSIQCKDIFPFT